LITQAPPASGSSANTTVLAFDFGEKRIGVAVGDLSLRIAHPLTTIHAEDKATRFAQIGKLVSEWRPVRFVVGLPMHADGAEHEVSRLARRFAHRLEGRFGVKVELVDERLTSVAAESRLRESGARRDEIAASLDAAAAREILDSYFATVIPEARESVIRKPSS
jgi:putative Holliday junction resolvase